MRPPPGAAAGEVRSFYCAALCAGVSVVASWLIVDGGFAFLFMLLH